jgi:chromosome segregation ATPase
VELVTALEEAGVRGPRQRKTLDRLIARAAQQVDAEDLQHQAEGLATEIERLEAQRQKLNRSIEEGQRRIKALLEKETALRDRLDALAREVAGYEDERTMLHATRLVLERGEANAPASSADAQPSKCQDPNQKATDARSAAPQCGQWWDQLVSVLQECDGQPNTGSEKENM